MSKFNARRLCLNGVISSLDYWRIRKLKKKVNRRPEFTRNTFTLDDYTLDECFIWFRFSHEEIRLLVLRLGLNRNYKLTNGGVFNGLEGFCIVLRRLSYPTRLNDLVPMFNRDPGTISRIFNFMIKKLYCEKAHRLRQMAHPYLTRQKLLEFSEYCSMAGSPYTNIVGFIDGTQRPICRPTYAQREYYSGYKRHHAIKYQSVVYPNGLIGRLDGPYIGRRHDSAILHLSRFIEEAEDIFPNQDGSWFAIYGDAGYANQKFIKVGFKNVHRLSERHQEFNRVMSSLRVGVEYGFGKIIQQFAFLDYKKNQKLYLMQLKSMYCVAAFLINCQSCMRGTNQVHDIFGCPLPTLEEYIL